MGDSHVQLSLPGATVTVGRVRESLLQKYPPLKNLTSIMIAVNNSYADNTDFVRPTDEIAVIPPVSGG